MANIALTIKKLHFPFDFLTFQTPEKFKVKLTF